MRLSDRQTAAATGSYVVWGLLLEVLLVLPAGLAAPQPPEAGLRVAGAPPFFGAGKACGVRLVPMQMYRSLVRDESEEPVAFRTTYMASISVGRSGSQKFQVIFDTGSGQVIVPSAQCSEEACLMHARYNSSDSPEAVKVQMDGTPVRKFAAPEIVSIRFGAGKVSGEMVEDLLCLGEEGDGGGPCVLMNSVTATKLSANPFALFPFDGIVGLGLPQLSLTPRFHLMSSLFESGVICRRQFAFYISEGGEGTELALGGVNPEHLDSPLRWVDVVSPEKGHWQVEILGFHVGNYTLERCKRGGCKGVLDTGTSHIAVPAPDEEDVVPLLSSPSEGLHDCRFLEDYPTIVVELRGFNLTLHPQDYMRQMPMPSDLQIGSGAATVANDSNRGAAGDQGAGDAENATEEEQEEEKPVPLSCKSRVVGVTMPPQLGTLFILGQPVFHRYYTVFDYDGPRMGFGLAAARTVEPSDEEWQEAKVAGVSRELPPEEAGVAAGYREEVV